MFNKMLIPIDTKDYELSTGIVPYAAALAKGLNIPVVLNSVVNPDDIDVPQGVKGDDLAKREGLFPHPSYVAASGAHPVPPENPVAGEKLTPDPSSRVVADAYEAAKEVEFEVKMRLNEIIEQLGIEGVWADSVVSTSDDVVAEIMRHAEDNGCDIIAMAAHDRNLLEQAIKGSVTNEVARTSRVPVLAFSPVQNDEALPVNGTISRILVPLDGTEFAESVLPYVEHIARTMSLGVLLVRVLELGDVFPLQPKVNVPQHESRGALREISKDRAGEYLESIAEKLSDAGVSVSKQVLRGAPETTRTERIASMADILPDSLIAVASHGRSGLNRWVMGSVAEDLLRDTASPVLIIPSLVAENAKS